MALVVSLKILGLTMECSGSNAQFKTVQKTDFFGSLDRRLVTRFSKSRPSKMVGQSCTQRMQHCRPHTHPARHAGHD